MCRDREKVLYHHVMVMWSSRDLWMDFRYECVDWLFCNAGLMPVSGVNWRAFWPPTPRFQPQPLPLLRCQPLSLSNLGYQLGTGGDLLPVTDWQTSDGLQQVFSTNLFGHYLMVPTHTALYEPLLPFCWCIMVGAGTGGFTLCPDQRLPRHMDIFCHRLQGHL